MASVFYLVIMFMLCIMMVSNNNLYCEAALTDIIGSKCERALGELYAFATSTSTERVRGRCSFVPNTTLSGHDFVLCKCKAQELFASKNGGYYRTENEYPLVRIFKKLDNNTEFAKSCGIIDGDCNTAFPSVESKCLTEAREAMKTCAPMVKAASEYRLGNRTTQTCCSLLKKRSCQCNSYRDEVKNAPESREKTVLSKALQSLNDTLRDKCGLYSPVCEQSQDPFFNERRGDDSIKWRGNVVEDCVINEFNDLGRCAEFLPKSSRMQVNDFGVEEAPLVDFVTGGCCLDRESCKCDPRSVSCCQKLGELSKKGRDSCMCELLNSKTTPDSTIEFLNFVRARDNNYILIKSCQSISTVYTDTCAPPLPRIFTKRRNNPRPKGVLNRGFNTRKNPNDRTIPT